MSLKKMVPKQNNASAQCLEDSQVLSFGNFPHNDAPEFANNWTLNFTQNSE